MDSDGIQGRLGNVLVFLGVLATGVDEAPKAPKARLQLCQYSVLSTQCQYSIDASTQ